MDSIELLERLGKYIRGAHKQHLEDFEHLARGCAFREENDWPLGASCMHKNTLHRGCVMKYCAIMKVRFIT